MFSYVLTSLRISIILIFLSIFIFFSGTIEVEKLKDLKISLENGLKTSEKKVRDVTSEKDDAEVMLSRKEKEMMELTTNLEDAVQRANTAENKYRQILHEVQTQRNDDLKISSKELNDVQKEYRISQMNLMKSKDELEALSDRMKSMKMLANEREAALVQQLQTYRKTVDDTSQSVRCYFFILLSFFFLFSPFLSPTQKNSHSFFFFLPNVGGDCLECAG